MSELLRQELSVLLARDMSDPRVAGIVSVTHVDVSPDLRRAHALVSVLGSEAERASTMVALRSARPFLRRELAQRLRLRNTPDLEFEDDRSIERAQALTDMMRENARQRGESL